MIINLVMNKESEFCPYFVKLIVILFYFFDVHSLLIVDSSLRKQQLRASMSSGNRAEDKPEVVFFPTSGTSAQNGGCQVEQGIQEK